MPPRLQTFLKACAALAGRQQRHAGAQFSHGDHRQEQRSNGRRAWRLSQPDKEIEWPRTK